MTDGEEMVAVHVKDTLLIVQGHDVGSDLEYVAPVDGLHVEGVVGPGERE